jgi:ubiquinone/menaquinone biosynthesis C-methylase UbiE
MSHALGLPLEYRKHPQFFDAINIGDDTDAKNNVIEHLLRDNSVRKVLDLTCGTGNQVFYLTKRGYDVTGADFSPALVKKARVRARREKTPLRFIDGDMRRLRVGEFDAVITIFNAIGHVNKAGFEQTLRNVHRNLKEGGIYVFDIFNLEALTDQRLAGLSCHNHKQVGDTQIHRIQCSTLNRAKGQVTSHDSYMVQDKAKKPRQFQSSFTLQIYTAQELHVLLKRTGFEVVRLCGMDGAGFERRKSQSVVTVARKIPGNLQRSR